MEKFENFYKQMELINKTQNKAITLHNKITNIKLTEEEKKQYGGIPFTDDEIRRAYARAIMEYSIEMDIVKPYNVEDFLNDCFELADKWRIELSENESPKSDLEKRYK